MYTFRDLFSGSYNQLVALFGLCLSAKHLSNFTWLRMRQHLNDPININAHILKKINYIKCLRLVNLIYINILSIHIHAQSK